jgi:hypothetical protein
MKLFFMKFCSNLLLIILLGSNTPQFLFLLTLFSTFLYRDTNSESVFCQVKPTSDLFNRFIISLTVIVPLRRNVFLMTREYTCLIISVNSGSKSRRLCLLENDPLHLRCSSHGIILIKLSLVFFFLSLFQESSHNININFSNEGPWSPLLLMSVPLAI